MSRRFLRLAVLFAAGLMCRPVACAQDTDAVPIPGTNISVDLTLIPGGTFEMGSQDGADDERPIREVSVPSFWMMTTEVTSAQFAPFRYQDQDSDSTAADVPYDADAIARPSPPYEDPSHGMATADRPIAGMTQWAALRYAKWLSDKTGHFYRLPTEAEWEYACRGGTQSPFGLASDTLSIDDVAWYWDNSGEESHPVASLAPNAHGLYDMTGNVAEWTLDQYQEDAYAVLDSAHALTDGPWRAPDRLHPRTVRGGAYDDDPNALRCANRLRSNLNWKRRDPQIPKSYWWNTDSPFVGFRLVRPVNPPSPEEQETFWMLTLGE